MQAYILTASSVLANLYLSGVFLDAVRKMSRTKFVKVSGFHLFVHHQGCNLDFKAMTPPSSYGGKSPKTVGKGTQSVKSISKWSFNGRWQHIRGAQNVNFILQPVCQIPSELLPASVESKPLKDCDVSKFFQ